MTVPSAWVTVMDTALEKTLIVFVRFAAWPAAGHRRATQSSATAAVRRGEMRLMVMPTKLRSGRPRHIEGSPELRAPISQG